MGNNNKCTNLLNTSITSCNQTNLQHSFPSLLGSKNLKRALKNTNARYTYEASFLFICAKDPNYITDMQEGISCYSKLFTSYTREERESLCFSFFFFCIKVSSYKVFHF